MPGLIALSTSAVVWTGSGSTLLPAGGTFGPDATVPLAVRGRWHRGGVTDDTDHHLYDRLRRCQDRASRDATGGMYGGDGGNPEEPTALGPPRGAGGRR